MADKLYRATTVMTPEIYRDFYKHYYRERLKVFRIISTIIGILFLSAAFMMFYGTFSTVWIVLLAWLGLFLLVYPHMAYRRPYKRARNYKQTTSFSFYEDYVSEKTNGESGDYNYSELLQVIEAPKYIYIYHTIESVSIVEKDSVKEGSEGLCSLLKSKTKYKKLK